MLGKFKFSKWQGLHNFTLKHQGKLFKRNFTTANLNESSVKKGGLLNSYLMDSLTFLRQNKLQSTQINIVENINKNSHSMILCDDFSGRRISCALGVMNRVLQNKTKEIDDITDDDLYVSTKDVFKELKSKAKENLEKRNLKPRGALIICQKFDFATHFYRICRKIDYQNKLRMVRVGTSLHTVSPTVELDPKAMSDGEDFATQEAMIGNINLVNTTSWKNIDMLFITPHMLEYVFSQKDEFDYFDINPEVIVIDDFDYILNSESYDIKEILSRFFNPNTFFKTDSLSNRKLVLTSSTLQVDSVSSLITQTAADKFSKSIEVFKNYLGSVNKDFIQKLEIITSQNFMDLDHYMKGIKLQMKLFDGEGRILFDKKLKYLHHLLEHDRGKTVICCSDLSISVIKENYRRKKHKFLSIDEHDRISSRLFSVVLFNKHEHEVLFITPMFLKSLNLVNVHKIIVFDFISDTKDFIRILSKFPKTQDKSHGHLHILTSYKDIEKNQEMVEYLKTHDKYILTNNEINK